MDEIVNLILNSGVTVVILAYFIYRDNKFMTTLTQTLTTLVDTVEGLKQSMKLLDRLEAFDREED